MFEHLSENDRLREFVTELADRVGLGENDRQALDIAASIVGVGRLPVFDILEKKGTLSPEELARVRDIPKIWSEFTGQLGFLQVLGVPEIVESYCESWDGSGYPRGLAGEEIPLGARILAVCYHYNGMISDRPYRKAFPHGRAADEVRRMSGRLLDPALVETFIEMVEEKRRTARLTAKAEAARPAPVPGRELASAQEAGTSPSSGGRRAGAREHSEEPASRAYRAPARDPTRKGGRDGGTAGKAVANISKKRIAKAAKKKAEGKAKRKVVKAAEKRAARAAKRKAAKKPPKTPKRAKTAGKTRKAPARTKRKKRR